MPLLVFYVPLLDQHLKRSGLRPRDWLVLLGTLGAYRARHLLMAGQQEERQLLRHLR